VPITLKATHTDDHKHFARQNGYVLAPSGKILPGDLVLPGNKFRQPSNLRILFHSVDLLSSLSKHLGRPLKFRYGI